MLRGEVWWVEFDPAVGSEIKKTRPALIISNNAANRNISRVVVIPLTSSTDNLYPGEALVHVGHQKSKVMSDQIMATDKKRLKSMLGVLSKEDLKAVEEAIKEHLALPK